MKKISVLLLMMLLAASLLVACGTKTEAENEPGEAGVAPAAAPAASPSAAPSREPESAAETAETRVVTDELGHELTIPAKPVKVFAPYMEDSLVSLGVKPVAQWANGDAVQEYLQDKLDGVPGISFTGGLPPSPEAVLDLAPDLIILHTAHYAKDGVYEKYSKIAPTYVFNNAAGDLKGSITKLGELLGRPAEAELALQAHELKVKEAKAKLAPYVEGKKAALINFNGKGMYLIGGNYFGGYVLSQELGIGKSKLVETENSADVSLEIVPQIDADYIFTINYQGTGSAFIQELTGSPIWKSMPAAKAGHVYEVSDKYWTGSGLIAYGKIIDDVVRLLAHE
ncbi:ABC transporter substrate-binding protein [Paenibacillus albidus]|uniref:ABC transporter substrate-binding protein n=1 Tax=Paenibacillus albidus TaxID=2041023 RepID=UPI0020351A99|nr:ABC transporter substrate-binding protein [Paenibacillus albidus]